MAVKSEDQEQIALAAYLDRSKLLWCHGAGEAIQFIQGIKWA